jgi:hypothetical protein
MLLPVGNPGYIFVRESAATLWKKATSLFNKKKGSLSSKPSSTTFEEALGFRVSSEHEGGHDTTEEE